MRFSLLAVVATLAAVSTVSAVMVVNRLYFGDLTQIRVGLIDLPRTNSCGVDLYASSD